MEFLKLVPAVIGLFVVSVMCWAPSGHINLKMSSSLKHKNQDSLHQYKTIKTKYSLHQFKTIKTKFNLKMSSPLKKIKTEY